MKKLLLAGALLASFNAFSQSYMILSNGITLTVDKKGFVYDFGNFVAPYKVSANGGQFLIEDEKLSTVDVNGFFYQKDLKLKNIKGKGLNYILSKDNDLITIAENGFYYKFDKDKKMTKKISNFGGNFFTSVVDEKKNIVDLYTVNTLGNYYKIDVAGLNPADIKDFGGKYFQDKAGSIYTVSKDGFVFKKSDVTIKKITKKGGNFFIDDTNKLYTVSDDGLLILPILPYEMKVSEINKLGSNYMIDTEGRVFTADSEGNLFERYIDHDLRNTKVLSL